MCSRSSPTFPIVAGGENVGTGEGELDPPPPPEVEDPLSNVLPRLTALLLAAAAPPLTGEPNGEWGADKVECGECGAELALL